MSLVLARVDQRLIHGIVVTQWAGATKAKRLMVVDDEVSKDEIQKSAMRMSKPAECQLLTQKQLLIILKQGNMIIIMFS